MSTTVDRLADYLGHYFSHAFEAAGLDWSRDSWAEMTDIAEAVLAIARGEAQAAVRDDAADVVSNSETFRDWVKDVAREVIRETVFPGALK